MIVLNPLSCSVVRMPMSALGAWNRGGEPRRPAAWLCVWACALALGLGACDETTTQPDDTIPYLDSDPCQAPASGRLPCATTGAFCRDHLLIMCGPDEAGCLVETAQDCHRGGTDVCLAEPTPHCAEVDACQALPNRCAAAHVACDADTLVICASNADGCLIEQRIDCTSGTTDYCDAGVQPRCVANNPCATISNCTQIGRRCEGDDLVLCGMDLNGCLVESTVDCLEGGTNACDPGEPAVCVVDPCRDPDGTPRGEACSSSAAMCAQDSLTRCQTDAFGCPFTHVTDCVAAGGTACDAGADPQRCVAADACPAPCVEGSTCDAQELVVCAADAFGCLVESRFDCTTLEGGFCAADSTPTCAVSTADRCAGKTLCAGTRPGTSCPSTPGDEGLLTCAYDDVGCLVEEAFDCASNDQVCAVDGAGVAQCADACWADPACAAASEGDGWCNGDTLEVCLDVDGDSCLDLVATPCTAGWCDASGSTPMCTVAGTGDACDDMLVLRGDRLLLEGQSFAADFRDTVTLSDASCGAAGAGTLDVVVRVPMTAGEALGVEALGLNKPRIVVLDGACSDAATCMATMAAGPNGITAVAPADGDMVVVIEVPATASGPYAIAIGKHVCGDGVVDFPEGCEDGNSINADGCSGCAVDVGFACDNAVSPSACTAIEDLGTYAAGDPIAAVVRGPLADGATLWFAITFTDAARLTGLVTGKPAGDVDVVFYDAAGVEVARFASPGDEPFAGLALAAGTYTIAVEARYGVGDVDVVQLSLATQPIGCGDGFVDLGEGCDDGNTANGDGCTSTCAVQGAATCVWQPSVCGADVQANVTPGITIPDNDAVGVGSALTMGACVVAALVVDVEISHPYAADLVVDLLAPDGTSARLHGRTVGSGTGVVGRYPDTLVSAEPLTAFVGTAAAGDWTLHVTDLAAADTGTLVSWGLVVVCQ